MQRRFFAGAPARRARKRSFLQRLLPRAAASLALLASGAGAAGLQVAPVLVEFASGETSQVLRLFNSSTSPLRAQVRVQAWAQSEGVEQLQPTRDIVASPPILALAAGRTQLVRLVRLQAAGPAGEKSYRLLIDELPPEVAPGRQGVQFLLQHSVPLFVLPAGVKPAIEQRGKPREAAELEVQMSPAGETVQLAIRNRSAQRVRLSELSYVGPDGRPDVLEPGLLGYVLAGQQMRWSVQLAPARLSSGGSFRARLNDDPEPTALPLVPASR